MNERNRKVIKGFDALVKHEWIESYRRINGYWSVIDRRGRFVDIGRTSHAEAFLKGITVATVAHTDHLRG